MQTTIEPKRFCWSRFYRTGAFVDPRGRGHLWRPQSARVGAHSMRAVGLEASWWWAQVSGMSGPVGAFGSQRSLESSGKKTNRYNAPKRVLSKFHAKSPTVPFPAAWNFLRPWMCSGSRAESNGPFSGILSAGTTTWDMRCLSGQGFSIWYM